MCRLFVLSVRRALAHARKGLYSGRALRAVSGTPASRWLVGEGDTVEVAPALRDAIEWRTTDLVDAAQIEALGQFDTILCRNVLIYFSDQTTVRVLERLTAALKAGGLLAVGASESLIHLGTVLECDERAGSFFDRKQA